MKLQTSNFKLKKTLFLFFIFYVLCFMFALPAHAQSVSLGIYPPIFQIQTTPPSDIKVPFFIENPQDSSVDLNISLKPFTAADSEDGQVQFLDSTSSYPDPFLLDRVLILDNGNPVSSVTLSPTERKNLILEIQIPPNEQKGDYYFSIIFSSVNSLLNGTTSSRATAGIASNVLLTVGPVGKTQGFIQEFSAPFFVSRGPVPFTVRIKNTSDHYITPEGNILITNMFGQTIGKVDLLPVNILSNTIRKIPDSMQAPNSTPSATLRSYLLNLKSVYAVWPEEFLFGPYKARLTVALSSRGPIFTREISFFAFPLEYALGILVIIAIVIFIVLRVKKRLPQM